MRRHLVPWSVLFALAAWAQATAATLQPWKTGEDKGLQSFAAPSSDAGRRVLVLAQPAHARQSEDFNAWFVGNTSAVISALKFVSESVGPIESNGIYSHLAMKGRVSERTYDLHFVAFETETQRRSILIVLLGVAESHAAAAAALRFAQTNAIARNMGLLAEPPPIAAIVGETPATPSTQSVSPARSTNVGNSAMCFQAPFGPSTKRRPEWAVNGTGIGDEGVAGVFRFSDLGVSLGGLTRSFHTMILLRDGRFVTNMYASPRDLASNHRGLNNGVWRKSGAGVDVKWSTGESEHIDPALELRPAPADLRLSGIYGGGTTTNLISPTGQMTGFAAVNQRYTFSADGRFSLQDSVGAVDSKGVGAQSSTKSGRYCIAAYSISFAFDNGERDNQLFGLAGAGGDKPQAVFIGSKEYGRQ